MEGRFGFGREEPADWSGRPEATNGRILGVEPLGLAAEDRVEADESWRCYVEDKTKGIRLRILFTDCDYGSADRFVAVLSALFPKRPNRQVLSKLANCTILAEWMASSEARFHCRQM